MPFENVVSPARGKNCASYGRVKLGSAIHTCLRQGAPEKALSLLLELEEAGFPYLVGQEIFQVIDFFMPSFLTKLKNQKEKPEWKRFLLPIFPTLQMVEEKVLNSRIGGLLVGDGTLELGANSNTVRIRFRGHVKLTASYVFLMDLLGSLFYFAWSLQDRKKERHLKFSEIKHFRKKHDLSQDALNVRFRHNIKHGESKQEKSMLNLAVSVGHVSRVSFLLSKVQNHLLGKDFRPKFNVYLEKVKANKKQGKNSYAAFYRLKPLDAFVNPNAVSKIVGEAFPAGFADADAWFNVRFDGTKNKATGLKSCVRIRPIVSFAQKDRALLVAWGDGLGLKDRFEKSAVLTGRNWQVNVNKNNLVALCAKYFRKHPPSLKLVDSILWQIMTQLKADKAHLTKTGLAYIMHWTWLRRIGLDDVTFTKRVQEERENNAESLRCKEFTHDELEAMVTPDLNNFKSVFPPEA